MPKLIPFTKPIKIYYYKDESLVSVSFLITENLVLKTEFTELEFDTIRSMWNINDGVQGLRTEHNGKIWWERRTVGPRPDEIDCDHVVIDIKDFNFRFETKDIENMFEEYQFQKNNTMHWDMTND